MTELSGTLEGVGVSAIVRFISGLKKRGCLRITQYGWQGEIYFDDGHVTDARLGTRSGLAVLDALVELLPGAIFAFDSQALPSGEPTIRLSSEALEAHLDDVSERLARGTPKLPRPDAVPVLVVHAGNGEEPLALDRGTLQTLLAVDARRDVREVVAARGSFDALWQLGTLIEVGLVESASSERAAAVTPTPERPAAVTPKPEPTSATTRLPERPAAVMPWPERPAAVMATPEHPTAVMPTPEPPAAVTPPQRAAMQPLAETEAPLEHLAPPEQAAGHCPKLGFDDDAGHSFDRPTRLHRCFAAGAPLPLSLDQQRELCLSDQFGTCPRLAPPTRHDNEPAPEPDEPRIVRLPFASRFATAARDTSNASAEPRRLRAAAAVPQEPSSSERPRPLRARLDRTTPFERSATSARPNVHSGPTGRNGIPRPTQSAASARDDTPSARPAVLEPPPVVGSDQEPPHLKARAAAQVQPETPAERRLSRQRIASLAGGAVALIVLAAVGYWLLPQASTLFRDESIDPAALPNTSRVAAGTPVAALTAARATPAAAANRTDAAAAQPNAAAAGQAQPTVAAAAQPAVTEAAVQPTPIAQPTTGSAAQPATRSAAGQPTPIAAAAQVAGPKTLLDERFTTNSANWPSNPQGVAALVNGSYRISPRQAGQFVAIGAPITSLPADVVVSAAFRKLAGPSGGGYGLIVRDQSTSARDGTSQDGQYYVVEAGDKGEVGIWRREADHWVDIQPWQPSDAVKPGTAANELTVRAVGNTLSFLVNGTQVATKTDSALSGGGGVGLFVGGDGNQVAVDSFSVQTP
jgi:hypothetical protein